MPAPDTSWSACGAAPTSAWVRGCEGGGFTGEWGVEASVREFFAEFNTAQHRVTDASITRRPDAISLDYRTAYSLGPEAIGTVAPDAREYTVRWRVRADDANNVWIARESGGGFAAETLLFAYTGALIEELDFAFDQNASPVVCAERAGQLFIYFFDPTVPGFTFASFGAGRTPRCVLDTTLASAESDVLVFYMRDAAGALAFRQQRDRYQVEFLAPDIAAARGVPSTQLYIEDVARTRDNRLAVIYSLRNLTLGQYSLHRQESALYPYFHEPDGVAPSVSIVDGSSLVTALIAHILFDIDNFAPTVSIAAGSLLTALIAHILFDIDTVASTVSVGAGTLLMVVIPHTLFDIDQAAPAVVVQAGTLAVVVIAHTLFDIDKLAPTMSVTSGSLVAA